MHCRPAFFVVDFQLSFLGEGLTFEDLRFLSSKDSGNNSSLRWSNHNKSFSSFSLSLSLSDISFQTSFSSTFSFRSTLLSILRIVWSAAKIILMLYGDD
jgi:hypothetical protein